MAPHAPKNAAFNTGYSVQSTANAFLKLQVILDRHRAPACLDGDVVVTAWRHESMRRKLWGVGLWPAGDADDTRFVFLNSGSSTLHLHITSYTRY